MAGPFGTLPTRFEPSVTPVGLGLVLPRRPIQVEVARATEAVLVSLG